jgi:L-fucose mutarotase/ribose pyranase (RbsD/FucU family)
MRKLSVILIAWLFMNGCTTQVPENKAKNETPWKTEFNSLLPLLGHRNWILVVDKAFPMQTSQGLTIINTGEKLAPVLKYVLDQIDGSTHVQPAVYHDAELNYLTSEQVQGKEAFLSSVNQVLGNLIPVPILHDSVFVKIDRASKLFRVVVLKTEETIPYTSVFIELGCKYWSGDNEKELRKSMEEKTK